jgi:hypothetical protein
VENLKENIYRKQSLAIAENLAKKPSEKNGKHLMLEENNKMDEQKN